MKKSRNLVVNNLGNMYLQITITGNLISISFSHYAYCPRWLSSLISIDWIILRKRKKHTYTPSSTLIADEESKLLLNGNVYKYIYLTTEPCASISDLKAEKDHLLLKNSIQLGGLTTMQQLQHGSQRDSPESKLLQEGKQL